eukprot:351929-Prymnesium_polylepis.1
MAAPSVGAGGGALDLLGGFGAPSAMPAAPTPSAASNDLLGAFGGGAPAGFGAPPAQFGFAAPMQQQPPPPPPPPANDDFGGFGGFDVPPQRPAGAQPPTDPFAGLNM